MKILRLLGTLFIACTFSVSATAQVYCPPNIDFENGDLSQWNFYTGTYSTATLVLSPPTPVAPIACRHTLTSATGLIGCTTPVASVGPIDEYGGFPVLAPGGGSYSFKLGNKSTGAQAERAVYYVHVPATISNYSLVYRYAVVFQNPPSHSAAQQPRFEVKAFDSASMAPIPCAEYTYIASSGLPGFMNSPCTTCSPNPSTSTPIFYKDWTTSSIDLSSAAGTTVAIEFTNTDCSQGGHFGYGYVDLSCGLFQIAASTCDTLTPPTLSAPPGFETYTWYDSATFSILYGTTQSITIPFPPGPTTIAVILGPYAGFGCPDTLYTRIIPAHLALNPSNDTAICAGRSVVLYPNATDIALPLTYSWAPAAGLSCTTCANPVATPTATTSYTVTVTNASGCTQEHVYNISILPAVNTSISVDTPSCNGYNNGSATVTPLSGTAPYYYTWTTAPTQTTSTATGLPAGTYTVMVVDALGCTDTNVAVLLNPAPRIISIAAYTNPTTCFGNEGTITITGMVSPDTTYTISYRVNGVLQTQTLVADATGQLILTGLIAATYSDITIINALCPYNTIGPVVLVDPPNPDLSGVSSNSFVCEGDTLMLFASSTTSGVGWSWSGPAGFTSMAANPMIFPVTLANAGTYSVTVSKNNCYNYASIIVDVRPRPVPSATSNTPVCSGDTLFLHSTSANGATSYSWSGPEFFSSVDQNPYIAHVQTVATGAYTVNVTLNGCMVPAIVNVVVNQTPQPPVGPDTNYCQYDVALPFEATGTNVRWYTSSTSVAGDTGTAIAPTPSTTEGHTETWYIAQTSAEGCTSERGMVSAKIWPMPYPSLSLTSDVTCAGKYLTFTLDGVGEGADGLTWYFEPGDSVQNVNPVYHAFNNVGTFNVQVNSYYRYCRDTVLERRVDVFPYASLDLGPDTSICPGSMFIDLAAVRVSSFASGATWKWNTGETSPSIRIVAPGTYAATISVNGCETTDSIIVSRDCYLDIPNVFTPNGDGINDFFFPRQLLAKGLTRFSMSIYNRWGQQIFSGGTLDGRGWDGNLNGAPQPEGVYVYVIDAEFKDGQKESHKGNVTLLR